MSKSTNNKQNVKKRNWTFVCYPESLPPNWIELLQKTGLQCAISPLHDRDINANGEPKKPHYHVILCYSGPTAYSVVSRLTQNIFNATIPQPLEQVRGMYRYFSHKDNPEKAQYDEKDIKFINGFNIRDFVELTASEVDQIKKQLTNVICELKIIEYSDLMDYLRDNDFDNEWNVASNHTMFFTNYIKSKRYKKQTIDNEL
jgi:hypothetical protein